MQSVVFKTKGTLDLRAITTFGINSKPNSKSPIGFFGTGLKYAIAVLVRTGHDVTLLSDGKKYTFKPVKENFRDKEFDFIEIEEHGILRWIKKQRLPYTTELGKTWKVWQAFRELFSNTLDEDGETLLLEQEDLSGLDRRGYSYLIISGEEFVHEYHEKDKTFLPEGLRTRQEGSVQIIDKPSQFVYYRGMRVHELQKPSVVTYNILAPLDLTEDRTAKYDHYVQWYIRNGIVTADKPEVVEAVLTADKEKYEHKIDFKEATESPSDTFIYVAKKLKEEKRSYNHSSMPLIRRWDDSVASTFKKKHWAQRMYDAVEDDKFDTLVTLIKENRVSFLKVLEDAVPEYDGSVEEVDAA